MATWSLVLRHNIGLRATRIIGISEQSYELGTRLRRFRRQVVVRVTGTHGVLICVTTVVSFCSGLTSAMPFPDAKAYTDGQYHCICKVQVYHRIAAFVHDPH